MLGPALAHAFMFRTSVPDVKKAAGGRGPALEDLYLRIDLTDNDDVDLVPFLMGEWVYPRLQTVMLEHAVLPARRSLLAGTPTLARLHLSGMRFHLNDSDNTCV